MIPTRQRRRETRSALDLVEESLHLLRQSPAALAVHCAGALPFAAGLLYFWADMSRGAYADRRCAASALALAALYVWMKTWQTVFACSLRASLSGETPTRWTWRRLARVVMIQAAIQPTLFIALPVAAVLTVPFVWTYAFYQNLTIVADDESGSLRASATKAWRLAWLWTGQNHFAIAASWFFGFFVFLNILIALWLGPHLLKTFLGIETDFTRGNSWMGSSTTFAIAARLAFVSLRALVALRPAGDSERPVGGAVAHLDDGLTGAVVRDIADVATFCARLPLWTLFALLALRAFWPRRPGDRSINEVFEAGELVAE